MLDGASIRCLVFLAVVLFAATNNSHLLFPHESYATNAEAVAELLHITHACIPPTTSRWEEAAPYACSSE